MGRRAQAKKPAPSPGRHRGPRRAHRAAGARRLLTRTGPGRDASPNSPWQKAPLHSTVGASRLTALFLGRICPICSLVTPCQPGALPVSVRLSGTFDELLVGEGAVRRFIPHRDE